MKHATIAIVIAAAAFAGALIAAMLELSAKLVSACTSSFT